MGRYRRRKNNDRKYVMLILGIAVLVYLLASGIPTILNYVKIRLQNSAPIMKDLLWVIVVIAILLVAAIITLIINAIINTVYERIIDEHSIALKALRSINSEYTFERITPHSVSFKLDNENYYDTITPYDCLVYDLVYSHKSVAASIKSAEDNRRKHQVYTDKISRIDCFDTYSIDKKPILAKKRMRLEKRLFNDAVLRPVTYYSINSQVILTDINGKFKSRKSKDFYPQEISEAIRQLGQKQNGFYLNDNIWQSICRVERGKVTNRMRFSIYNRDGNRCRECGSRSNLEIDHIFPVSKGGKSTYDNLQTLCHRCNSKKSNTIVDGAVDPKTKQYGSIQFCPKCGSTLIVRNGKNGKFLGCSAYPDCKFTKNL